MRILAIPEDASFLRQKSQLVKTIDRNLARFMQEMGKTLSEQHDPEGVGLSAVQIGRPVRILALNRKYFAPHYASHPRGLRPRNVTSTAGLCVPRAMTSQIREEKNKVVYYINPEIIAHSKEKTLGEEIMKGKDRPFLEGCLSVPDLYGEVLRWKWIKIKAMMIKEEELDKISLSANRYLLIARAEGLMARVFQHEMDHLNGVLFTDHVLKEGGQLYRWDGDELRAYNY